VSADESHPPTSRPPSAEILRREQDRLQHERNRLERERDTLRQTKERLRKEREELQRERERLEQEREHERERLERERQRIDRLERERERLERERERLEHELERVRQENARLRETLEAARRSGKRQAAPFSKGQPTAAPKRPGRKAGVAHGRHGQRPVPTHVDEVLDVPLPEACPHCNGALIDREYVSQYQEDLPPVRTHVREFHLEVGWCAACGRRVQARHPLQTSDAVGAAAVQLGPAAISLATILHTQLGLPVAKVATLFRQTWQLTVTPGGIIRALHRVADRARPTYDALVRAVQTSPTVVPDETGWRENGESRWLWVFVTPETTVYRITPGRGFDEATLVLPATYDGTITRDGWVAYRGFTDARHQTCLGHLLHRCHTLTEDHPRSGFAPAVKTILQTALAARDRHREGAVSDHGVAVIRGQLLHQLDRLLDALGRVPDVQRFARHLDREFSWLFTFLGDPAVDATNWRAEQGVRPAVAIRKVCGGNRSPRGVETQYILASVLRTAAQRRLDVSDALGRLQRSPRPVIPRGLRAAPT